MEEMIAHISEDKKRVQTVKDHEKGVAELARGFADVFGLGEIARLLGRNHDAGKYSPDFQKYIRGNLKRRIDHSTAGAKYLWKHRKQYKELAPAGAFCISGHHSGLLNMGTQISDPGDGTLMGRMKKEIPEFDEIQKYIDFGNGINDEKMRSLYKNEADRMMLIRMLFSCLVDADFLDTERFMQSGETKREGFPTLDVLYERFFEKLDRDGYLRPKNKINEKRTEILKRCIQMGEEKPGLYSLTVPTGGGKTISSLAYALRHAQKYGKRRIIYVIPYLAIIDQTAEIFRDFLGKEAVLECHSNVNYDSNESENGQNERMKLATENWDAPIIVTTSEQFWESLYANRTSKCRKLHNIAESVVVFDEAQMLPVNFLIPCLKALEQFVRYYGVTAVLCSATQPALNPYLESKPTEITENIEELYQFFKRVTFQIDREKDYDEIAKEIESHEEALCIASTKKEAREFFDRISEEDIFFLSTDLCPTHRKEVIREMKRRLRDKERCRVISTSVISVGVDIDFPVVYLEYTGLDSLIQGAGRCNREGKRDGAESIAHVFWTKKGMESPFMKKEKQTTDYVCGKYPDISYPDAIQEYFRVWFQSMDGENDKLSLMKKAKEFPFKDFGEKMKLIDEDTKPVFIRYNEEAKKIYQELYYGKRTRELMRRAGQYMVNVRFDYNAKKDSDFSRLLNQGKIQYFPNDSELAYLVNEEDYDCRFGLNTKTQDGAGIMW